MAETVIQGKCPTCSDELTVCPNCHKIVRNQAVTRRSVNKYMEGFVHVGFRCPLCNHEWGFEDE